LLCVLILFIRSAASYQPIFCNPPM
jgi:hypothetical protein